MKDAIITRGKNPQKDRDVSQDKNWLTERLSRLDEKQSEYETRLQAIKKERKQRETQLKNLT